MAGAVEAALLRIIEGGLGLDGKAAQVGQLAERWWGGLGAHASHIVRGTALDGEAGSVGVACFVFALHCPTTSG